MVCSLVLTHRNNANEVAWYKDNIKYTTHEVGAKKPNELGLHDMAGNVYELCLDGKLNWRNIRGGGWASTQESMRPSFKSGCRYVCSIQPKLTRRMDESHSYLGFRIAKTIDMSKK